MMMNSVKILTKGVNDLKLEINGVEINTLTYLNFTMGVNRPPVLKIEFYVDNVEIESEENKTQDGTKDYDLTWVKLGENA